MNYKTLLKISALLALLSANCTQASVHIFSCEPEWAALSSEIGGDLITASSATNALQDPHYVQARPRLIARVRKADLLICSGSELEVGWLPLRGKNVVLHHKSWAYLINWLGLKEVATLERRPGVPPSAAHLEDWLARMKVHPAAIIIRTPYQDSKPSQGLSNRTGIPNAMLPFTVDGSNDATNLLTLFDSTISILLEKMVTTHEQLY
ncbi:MAG: ABC-type Zn uptake system ZnuABC Zn-binding protein ZnuA [Halioglobus sp.]|jgi:ABC-type Zn uptake system ZnuABC Zn-binding protein ZnuA